MSDFDFTEKDENECTEKVSISSSATTTTAAVNKKRRRRRLPYGAAPPPSFLDSDSETSVDHFSFKDGTESSHPTAFENSDPQDLIDGNATATLPSADPTTSNATTNAAATMTTNTTTTPMGLKSSAGRKKRRKKNASLPPSASSSRSVRFTLDESENDAGFLLQNAMKEMSQEYNDGVVDEASNDLIFDGGDDTSNCAVNHQKEESHAEVEDFVINNDDDASRSTMTDGQKQRIHNPSPIPSPSFPTILAKSLPSQKSFPSRPTITQDFAKSTGSNSSLDPISSPPISTNSTWTVDSLKNEPDSPIHGKLNGKQYGTPLGSPSPQLQHQSLPKPPDSIPSTTSVTSTSFGISPLSNHSATITTNSNRHHNQSNVTTTDTITLNNKNKIQINPTNKNKVMSNGAIRLQHSTIQEEEEGFDDMEDDIAIQLGTDAYAAQNSGSSRFIVEECMYLTSSLLNCHETKEDEEKKEKDMDDVDICDFMPEDDSFGGNSAVKGSKSTMAAITNTTTAKTTTTTTTNQGIIRHSISTADAACDLALMLSSKTTRQTILSQAKQGVNEKNAVEMIVLDALSCVPMHVESPFPNTVLLGNSEYYGTHETSNDVKGDGELGVEMNRDEEQSTSHDQDDTILKGDTDRNEEEDQTSSNDGDHQEEDAWDAPASQDDWDDLVTNSQDTGMDYNDLEVDDGPSSGEDQEEKGANANGLKNMNSGKRQVKNDRFNGQATTPHHSSSNAVMSESFEPLLSQYDLYVIEALAIVVFHISYDCTKHEKYSASDTNGGRISARAFRKMLLEHEDALQGIFRLILVDPIVSYILREIQYTTNVASDDCLEMKQQSVQKEDDTETKLQGAGDELMKEDTSHNTSFEQEDIINETDMFTSPTTTKTINDPTRMGRSKKKNRKSTTKKAYPPTTTTSVLESMIPLAVGDGELVQPNADNNFQSPGGKTAYSSSVGGLDFMSDPGSARKNKDTVNLMKLRQKVDKALSIFHYDNHDDDTLTSISKGSDYEAFHALSRFCKTRIFRDHHTNKNVLPDEIETSNPGYLALEGIERILSGKYSPEEEDDTAIEESFDQYMWKLDVEADDFDEVEKANINNPLIVKNIMLRRSGCLKHLARAMAESLEAFLIIAVMVEFDEHSKKTVEKINDEESENSSIECLKYLQKRILCLSSILDGAVCLSDRNRKVLCQVMRSMGHQCKNEEEAPVLIPTLLKTISANTGLATVGNESSRRSVEETLLLSDVTLSAFRTLTSLTHDNDVASKQMLFRFGIRLRTSLEFREDTSCGAEILFYLLHEVVDLHQKLRDGKNDVVISLKDDEFEGEERKKDGSSTHDIEKLAQSCFDVTIFCLNILTNVLESSSSNEFRKLICSLRLSSSKGSVPNKEGDRPLALTWLTQWIVSQTTTFQDAILKGTAKSSGDIIGDDAPGKQSTDCNGDSNNNMGNGGDLEHHEDEALVIAGNGFIVLAYLLLGNVSNNKGDETSKSINDEGAALSKSVQNIILPHLPTTSSIKGMNEGKIFIIQVLKAFCNFYRYSVGDLSVAVVAPTINLIERLEKM